MRKFRYPCTGHVSHEGFAAFLDRELGQPRTNLHAFASELGQAFEASHLSLVNSGTSANLAAALAMAERAGPDAHAITAGFTFATTLSALLFARFRVTVVDTLPGGFAIDPDAVRRALEPRTSVVCVTHFLGFPADLGPLVDLADEHGFLLLQDACEGMDLRTNGEPVHRHGTLTTWSFYHPHHLPAHGGGAVISPDSTWQHQVESIVHWGRSCTCHYAPERCPAPEGLAHFFTYVHPGLNLALSELNACFGRFQLARWQEIESQRLRNYDILYQALHDQEGVRVYPRPADSGSPAVFPITLTEGSVIELAVRLAERGVEVRSLMGGTITKQPAFTHLPHDELTNCQAMSDASFFVGIHQTLPEEDVRAVAGILVEEIARCP